MCVGATADEVLVIVCEIGQGKEKQEPGGPLEGRTSTQISTSQLKPNQLTDEEIIAASFSETQ